MDTTALNAFGQRYAQAWCSQDPERVAGFYAKGGSLRVNEDAPSVGRKAIAGVAVESRGTVFRWTLTGTNHGPVGSGHRVRISGFEVWRLDADGLIAESKGHFDAAEYARQIEHGVGG